nr:hypothetical protein [Escherichia coli]
MLLDMALHFVNVLIFMAKSNDKDGECFYNLMNLLFMAN